LFFFGLYPDATFQANAVPIWPASLDERLDDSPICKFIRIPVGTVKNPISNPKGHSPHSSD
jgi:hypothetical protein